MKNCIKAEIWKALHNRMFLLSLSIGLIICMLHVLQITVTINALVPRINSISAGGGNPGYSGISLFTYWMGIDGYYYASKLFYFIWPILTALPFGWSYASERRGGLYNQIILRSGRNNYYYSKYLATFLAGGLTTTIPIFLNLFILATFCPYELPFILNGVGVFNYHYLSTLFYSSPWAYAIIWCVIQFLWSGTTACLCFIVGTKYRLSIMTILFPFVTLFIFDSLYTIIRSTGLFHQLYNLMISPLQLIQPVPITGAANPGWAVWGIWFILLLGSFSVGYWQVVKRELV